MEGCVEAIQAAGACADDDPEVLLDECEGGAFTEALPGEELETACDVVLHPERSEACAFLLPPAESDQEPDAGDQSNDGGAGAPG